MQARKLTGIVKYRYITAATLVIVGVAILLGILQTGNVFITQSAAEQWQGDSETEFSQVTVLIPSVSEYTENNVMGFREEVLKYLQTEGSIKATKESGHFYDAWSGSSSATVYSDRKSATVAVTPVGGDYFFFHPIKLLSGDYFRPNDFNRDRILLDEETAWQLFGGIFIVDMPVYIENQTFYVAGVIERETDKYSDASYTAGAGIYVPFESFQNLFATKASPEDGSSSVSSGITYTKKIPITCYEIVLANPVKNFASNAVKQCCKVEGKVVITNTGRFKLEELLGGLKNFFKRSIITDVVSYPYWENAARYATDSCQARLYLALICFGLALLLVIVPVVKVTVKGYNKLMDMGDEATEKVKEKMHI